MVGPPRGRGGGVYTPETIKQKNIFFHQKKNGWRLGEPYWCLPIKFLKSTFSLGVILWISVGDIFCNFVCFRRQNNPLDNEIVFLDLTWLQLNTDTHVRGLRLKRFLQLYSSSQCYREIFLKPGFRAVCYTGTMPRLVQIKTCLLGIIIVVLMC